MSMSGRLALLSIVFILLVGIAFLVPSLTFYRYSKLQERVDDAALVAEALLSTPNAQIDADQSEELLASAQVLDIAIIRDDRRERLLIPTNSYEISKTVDLIEMNYPQLIVNTVSCMVQRPNRVMRVIGQPGNGFSVVETAVEEAPICSDVRNFGYNLLIISIVIALVAGGILYMTVRAAIVRPILFLTRSITSYQGAKVPTVPVEIRSKIKEIRAAEASLGEMQRRISNAMSQKERLANLGESVAKIQHDLRNMLSTAHMVADNLEESDDPKVRKSAPRLVRAIDRAIELSSQTLEYGRVGERKARLDDVDLWEVVAELVEEEVDLVSDNKVHISFECAQDQRVLADKNFTRRIVQNLVRNARQILEEGDGGIIKVEVETEVEFLSILVTDNGPGLSQNAIDGLFQPFKGSSRVGGTGLGLAISKELAELMRGSLTLERTSPHGTAFVLKLPNKS